MPIRSVIAAFLLAFSLPLFALGVGDSAKVEWKGRWYDATILDQDDGEFYIHYRGYDSSWNEWVSPKRMRIQVLWNNKWYKARVLGMSGSRARIRYDGYGAEWDEWVTMDRMRSQ